jgi:hypothetical protein
VLANAIAPHQRFKRLRLTCDFSERLFQLRTTRKTATRTSVSGGPPLTVGSQVHRCANFTSVLPLPGCSQSYDRAWMLEEAVNIRKDRQLCLRFLCSGKRRGTRFVGLELIFRHHSRILMYTITGSRPYPNQPWGRNVCTLQRVHTPTYHPAV